MPLANWIECTAGDIRYIRTRKIREEDQETAKDAKAWEKVYDGYLKKYGLNKLYLRMLKTMQEKALLELNYVETRDRFNLTKIKIEEERLKNMVANNGEGLTIEESLIHLSKWIGYHLSTKKITVDEYFNLLKQYGKASNTQRDSRRRHI